MTITEIHAKHTFAANCYVVRSEKNNAFVVDPGAEGENIIGFMKEHGITPRMILLTHGHFDHVGAVKDLQAAWPGLILSACRSISPPRTRNCWRGTIRPALWPGGSSGTTAPMSLPPTGRCGRGRT